MTLAELAALCPDCPTAREARAWALHDLFAGAGYAVLPFAVAASVIALVGWWGLIAVGGLLTARPAPTGTR